VVQVPPRVPETAGAAAVIPDRPLEPQDVPDAPCINGPPGLRCDGLIGEDEVRSLPADIDAARKTAIVEKQFKDAHALVRLARLYLLRDGDVADADGPHDVARTLRFSRSAVAIDDTSGEARLMLALTLARSLQGARASAHPAIREGALSLVENVLRKVPAMQHPLGAAAQTLEGYLALERGQRDQALRAFEAATRLDPDLGTAWAGLGDVARSAGDFSAAATAYERAAARLPRDQGLARARRAAARLERLALPAASVQAQAAIAPGPVAPAPPAPPQCSPAEAAAAVGAFLCKGLARLAAASSPGENEQGAMLVLDGWREMEPLCEAKDPACGPHVLQGMAAASRAFKAAGLTAKSIAVAKILMNPRVPGAAQLMPELALEIGDWYFEVGVFDEAVNWYVQYTRLSRTASAPAAERARRLRAVLEAAASEPPPGPGSPVVCAAPLSCALKRLAGEAW
jgi:tetratricopeptide (TPR) repeat protein